MKTENAWPRWLLHLWLGWWSRLSWKHRIVPSPHLLLCLTVGSLLLILLHPTLKTLIYPWQKSKAASQLPSSNPGPLLCPELLECFVSGQLSPIISADLSVIQSRPLFFTLAALSYQVRTPHYLQIWPRPTFEMRFSFWGNAFNREMLTIIGANTAAFRSCLLDHQPSIIAQGQRKLGGLVWGGNRSFVILSHIS